MSRLSEQPLLLSPFLHNSLSEHIPGVQPDVHLITLIRAAMLQQTARLQCRERCLVVATDTIKGGVCCVCAVTVVLGRYLERMQHRDLARSLARVGAGQQHSSAGSTSLPAFHQTCVAFKASWHMLITGMLGMCISQQ
jgi:hypothetical protein